MSTTLPADALSAALFGKTRRGVLALLYGHADESFYLRQVVRALGGGVGAVQRELNQLSGAGIIRRSVQGNQVLYRANPRCPIFSELKSLVTKTVGAGDVLRAALASLADRINLAIIYGSLARNEEHSGSDVDLLVVGEASFGEIVSALGPAQEALAREVNPTVYSAPEFRSNLAARNHFLTSILLTSKIFLIGDENELARLASKRVAHKTQNQPQRNRAPAGPRGSRSRRQRNAGSGP